MLELRNLVTHNGEFELRIPALRLEAGMVHGLVAPSGSGKSTLLETLSGKIWTEEGDIMLDGVKLNRPPRPILLRYQEVALVHQHMELDRYHNVLQNLSLMRLDLGIEMRNDLAMQWLDYCELTDLADRLPDQLSGGQKQRLAITRLLIQEPRVILLDEPFSHQDLEGSERFGRILVDHARESGAIVLWASHDREEILRFCQNLLTVGDGTVTQCGLINDVYENPHHPYAEVLGPVQQIRMDEELYRFRPHQARVVDQGGWLAEVISYWPTDSGWKMELSLNGQPITVFSPSRPDDKVRLMVDPRFVVSP